MSRPPRILHIIYANPGAYPPVMHSSEVMRADGYEVRYFGVIHPNTKALSMGEELKYAKLLNQPRSGLRLKFFFFWFTIRATIETVRYRPTYIYVSDVLAAPSGWLVTKFFGTKVVYHEHDAPRLEVRLRKDRLLDSSRRSLVKLASACVIPNAVRAASFKQTLNPPGPVFVVWNCPRKSEIPQQRHRQTEHLKFTLAYAGTLNESRLPMTILTAMASIPEIYLRLIGYETVGSKGYVKSFVERARELGIADRVRYIGTLPSRKDVFEELSSADLALGLMPMNSDDLNMNAMAGASNKAFDAFACGTPILVSDIPDWREAFVDCNVAISCNPEDSQSVAESLVFAVNNRDQLRDMGRRGYDMVCKTWNYESQFKPVIDYLSRLA